MGGRGFQIRAMMAAVVAVVGGSLGGKWVVAAEVYHVVGGDRGWDPNSDLLSWSSGRVFRVGDQIWFAYSVAQGLIAEVKSREEYESCDVRNPIKMYTEGLHTVPLEREGIRYFASTDPENCNSGLKLHVQVLKAKAKASSSTTTVEVAAAAPTAPSGSPPNAPSRNTILMPMLMFCLSMLLAY